MDYCFCSGYNILNGVGGTYERTPEYKRQIGIGINER